MEDKRIPVWLDCDPGHDDTFAILLAAYHPAIRILGVSTVFGNASLEKTTRNATSILTAIGKAESIPVYACPPGTAWVVATGAFTNAALFLKYPDLVAHFAEFNVLADPEAAAAIFGNRALAAKTTLIPLDLSHLVLTTEGVRDLLLYGREEVERGVVVVNAEGKSGGKTRLRVMLVELLMFFAKTYSDVFGITEGPPLHDPLAVAAVLSGLGDQHEIPFCDCDPAGEPGLAQRERFEVTVVTEGTYEEARAGARTGQITARLLPPGEEGVRIPRSLDIPLFWKVLEECVSRADAANAEAEAAAAEINGPLAN
ncbi:hypothetical protein NEMBOFW57_002599 [Staphylotrichum longicolle]|uniref:Inosine/uridine-preferring nucleoside hydrolase domain-containing protein n=1 Tax=Staphylotrichum longicolle TaxID=669026 RepID=A0AAD4HYU3_9PEZI|nr:hypothetical protein NEMBOFW57_002599 [Staphylotrichum longicolle]